MTLPPPAELLRHRPPALLVDSVEGFRGATLSCRSVARRAWRWADLLEGTAQCAGLVAGLRPGGPGARAVIAEYRALRLHGGTDAPRVRFLARVDRRLHRFWRCRVEARGEDGALLLDGWVTIAPEPS